MSMKIGQTSSWLLRKKQNLSKFRHRHHGASLAMVIPGGQQGDAAQSLSITGEGV
jgi:hypothetical protein